MSELTLVIGNKNYSSWSMRPWLLMRQLGIEFDEVQIPLRQRDCRGRYGAAGEFLFGEFTVADAMFAPVASRFQTYGVELEGEAAEYARAILAVPAVGDWIEDAQREPWGIAKFDQA